MVSTRSRQGVKLGGMPLQGDQEPRILWHPDFKTSAGEEAIELGASAGLILDPWQKLYMHYALAEDNLGKWACFECGLVIARQNGKGSILEVRELAGLILFGEKLQLHSAHEFKTAQEAFLRIKTLFTEWDDLRRRVKKVTEAHGEEGIELLTGQRLRFVARSKRSGRGFSGDLLVYDEAMELGEHHVEASLPVLSARHDVTPGGPQVWYTGSAGDESSIVFGRVRNRGIAGSDPSLLFAEWSADEEVFRSLSPEEQETFLDDPRNWAQANAGAGIRITFDHIGRERRAMSSEAFARERLSIGRWPDPTAGKSVISEEQWGNVADEEARGQTNPVAFAIDMPPDRSAVSVAAARFMEDGRVQVELIARRQGTQWVMPWLKERVERWEPVCVAIGAGTAAATFATDWENDELLDDELLYLVPAADQAIACGSFYDSVVADEPTLVHRNQTLLNAAVKEAVKKKAGDAWKFDRGGLGDISPVWAVVLARHGLIERGDEEYDLLDSIH